MNMHIYIVIASSVYFVVLNPTSTTAADRQQSCVASAS